VAWTRDPADAVGDPSPNDGVPYALDPHESARLLQSDPDRGLTDAEAAARRTRFGPNQASHAERPPYLQIALRQFVDPLVGLLVIAAGVSAAIGEGVEAVAIGVIVVFNAILGFAQEIGAERAVLALRETLARRAQVIRAGRERAIPAEEIVPGDLLALREGERVPADARLVVARGLAVEESSLTGESIPNDKSVAAIPADTPLAERTSMVYAGTAVTRGQGRALVTATGDRTEIGTIVGLAATAKPPRTPLQRRIGHLTRVMVVLGIVVTFVLAGAMALQGYELQEAFLVGVSVAVAAVPEGLATTVTIALALGARDMAACGAIVRQLSAVETLGRATVIASDKTGTLTENRLTFRSAQGAAGRSEADVLRVAALASTAALIVDGDGVRAVGDPVDRALVVAARDRRCHTPPGSAVRELAFDSERKRMTVVYADERAHVAYMKGAAEVVLDRTTAPDSERLRLEALADQWAATGLRVLAVAERRLDSRELPPDGELEQHFEAVGLVALHDPLRGTAAPAMAEARHAGIRVEILTGDHPIAARAIGQALGLSDEAVHARVTPADKIRIVGERQAAGEVVAVTGDGVNDAPALRLADVGVAMGRSGTEAAREAADIVLTDDDFSTIVAAIREGRRISDNIRKFVAFLLSANFGEVVLFMIAIVAGLGPPMTVVQVLVINVLTDGLPAVMLARDPTLLGTMARPPDRSRRLFTNAGWLSLVAIGTLVGLAALGAFLVGRSLDPGAAQTMAFGTVGFAELGLVFAMRSPTEPAWRAAPNRFLLVGVVASAVVLALTIGVSALHQPFATTGLGSAELGFMAGFAVLPLVVVESLKAGARRRGFRGFA
jgi:Ca2+-transporting ATPase